MKHWNSFLSHCSLARITTVSLTLPFTLTTLFLDILLRFYCVPVDFEEVNPSWQATKTELDSVDSPNNFVLSPIHRRYLENVTSSSSVISVLSTSNPPKLTPNVALVNTFIL
ncbi:hypothetical protein H0H92_011118 [Tricholoma furcatifolium]|nr:hypothetical protein H0H92_011118 [Tricholoma furcatifolium]